MAATTNKGQEKDLKLVGYEEKDIFGSKQNEIETNLAEILKLIPEIDTSKYKITKEQYMDMLPKICDYCSIIETKLTFFFASFNKIYYCT